MIKATTIIRPGVWGLTKTDLRDAGREAIAAAALEWHRLYKKHHFQTYAVGRYGYRPRTPEYERRKARVHPEAAGRPLVFTGESERRAMSAETVEATATSFERFSGRAIIDAPALNYQRLADELTRLTTSEREALAAVFAAEFKKNFLATAERKMQTMKLGTAA